MASEPELQLDLRGQGPPKAKPAKGSMGTVSVARREAEEFPWYILPIRKAAHWQNGTLALEEQQIFPGFPCREAALRLLCCSGLGINDCDKSLWAQLTG